MVIHHFAFLFNAFHSQVITPEIDHKQIFTPLPFGETTKFADQIHRKPSPFDVSGQFLVEFTQHHYIGMTTRHSATEIGVELKYQGMLFQDLRWK
ncbi:Uncharacterised protein [Vibrio cholerae]|nr:Uncharacterised protein [Vibrio cholerae]CSC39774.1 Uncharacterised protein [Vibrio cholerae]